MECDVNLSLRQDGRILFLNLLAPLKNLSF